MLRIGTSGFSYSDWAGLFYPAGLRERDWLAYYAREFDTVELNVTFYRLPGPRTFAAWVQHTPPGFAFSVKAHRSLTHEVQHADYAGFNQAVQPLVEAGKLACVLAQFPPAFRPTPENQAHLARLRAGLESLPLVVEFRAAAWVGEPAFELLRSLGLGFVCVDEPQLRGLMPPVAVATGPVAYVRLHGRNAKQWYHHEHAWQRYDYRYSADELEEWAPRLRSLDQAAPLTLVYFNNTPRAQAIDDARALKRLLATAA